MIGLGQPIAQPLLYRRYVSGRFYTFDWCNNNDASAALVVGTSLLLPFSVPYPTVFSAVGLETTVAAGIGGLLDLAIFQDDNNGNISLITDVGTIDGTLVQYSSLSLNNLNLFGSYFVGVLPLVAAGTVRTRQNVNASTLGQATSATQAGGSIYSKSGLGAWPAGSNPYSFWTISANANYPKGLLQAA